MKHAALFPIALFAGAFLTACNHETHAPAPPDSYANEVADTVCRFDLGTCALDEANKKMHKDMAVAWSGDTDADFLRAMIPHHAGAVDMANAVIEHGHDPKIKALAAEIVRAQEREIAQMREMLSEIDRREGKAGSVSEPPGGAPHVH